MMNINWLFRALASAAFVVLVMNPVQECQADQHQATLEETFKAVILGNPRAPLADTAGRHRLSSAAAGGELGELNEQAAEALASDLVRSLSELLLREQAAAADAGGSSTGAEGAASLSSTWARLTDVSVEGGAVANAAATAAAVTPAAAAAGPEREGRNEAGAMAHFGEPCDHAYGLTAGGAGGGRKQDRGVAQAQLAERRRLRGDGSLWVGRGDTEAETPGGDWRALADIPSLGEEEVRGGGTPGGFAECEDALGTVGEEDFLKIESKGLNLVLTVVCVVCAGLAAGLTMGLLSIEPLEMAIKQRSGTPEEQLQASRILPLVSQHHFLLVTLLLFNSLANEALPIFLGNLVPSWLAVILSVSLVLFFGEIFPSAVFTGKYQLSIAAGMAWLVYFLMVVLAPVAWPIGWMLDRVLGIETFKRYNRAEISALMEVQHELSSEDVTQIPLHADEVAIVNGVLLTAERSVSEAMITMDKVFCLGSNEKLSASTMADIMAAGYSRVLVYEGNDTLDIRGYLQVKKLIILDPDDERKISTLMLRIPVVVSPDKSLLELLNIFQTGKAHLALVSNSPAITLECMKRQVPLEGAARPVGIITLEDIIEEIIQEEIMDESDRLTQFIEDNAKKTLLKFLEARQERLREGEIKPRLGTIAGGLGTPRLLEERTPLIKSRSFLPPSPPSPSYQTIGGSNSVDCAGPGDRTPLVLPSTPPGTEGRASLIKEVAGSRRRKSPARRRTSGTGATLGATLMNSSGRGRRRDDSITNEVDTTAVSARPISLPPDIPPDSGASSCSSVNAAPYSEHESRNGGV